MKKANPNSKKVFASIDDTIRKMRRNDPIQFDVLYREWLRIRESKGGK